MQNIYKFRLVLESKLSVISFEVLNYGTLRIIYLILAQDKPSLCYS